MFRYYLAFINQILEKETLKLDVLTAFKKFTD